MRFMFRLHNMSKVLVLSRQNLKAHDFDLIFPSGEKFGPGDSFHETCDDVIVIFEWKPGTDLLIPRKLASPSNDRQAIRTFPQRSAPICCNVKEGRLCQQQLAAPLSKKRNV